jgi:hypothetical protein
MIGRSVNGSKNSSISRGAMRTLRTLPDPAVSCCLAMC